MMSDIEHLFKNLVAVRTFPPEGLEKLEAWALLVETEIGSVTMKNSM